jgi:hypothetical protein
MNKRNTKYWIMGAIAVIIGIGLTFPFLIAKSRLNAEIAQLKKEGLPVTPREFANKYYKPIPKEENAAATFDAAYALYTKDKDFRNLVSVGTAQCPSYDQKIAPQLLSTAQEFIKGNNELLNKMSEIRKYDRIHFNHSWEDSYSIPLPHLNKLRNTARIFCVKMELIIYKNNPKQASELLQEMFHLSKLASQSPFMIGQLVFYACDTIAPGILQRFMSTLSFTSEQLKGLEKICSEHEQYVIKRWPYMWKAELTLALSWAKHNILDGRFLNPYKSYPYIKDIPKNYRIAFYNYSGQYINDIASQVRSSKAMMNVPVDIYVKRKRKLEKIRNDNKTSQHSNMFWGSNLNLYLKALGVIARLRCAKTACAVERFRLKYNRFPKTLEQLVPEFLGKVPIDPFDGKNLRYFRDEFDMNFEVPLPFKKKNKKEEKNQEPEDSMFGSSTNYSTERELAYKTVTLKKKGFYVYSVGKDLIDNKALSIEDRRHSDKDILFIVIDK